MNQALNKLPSLSNTFKILKGKTKYTSYIFLDREFYLKSSITEPSIASSHKKEKKCIIISPSLYWIRKKEISGSISGSKTKKIAEIVFEDIEEISEYEKIAVKGSSNIYYFIAVDSKQVLKNIQNLLGIDGSGFDYAVAQEVFYDNQTQIELNNNSSLLYVDGIIEKIPSSYVESQRKINFQTAIKSIKPNFSVFSIKRKKDRGEHYENGQNDEEHSLGRWAKIAGIAAVIFGVALISDSALSLKRASDITKKTDELRESFKLPQTTMELDNILSRAKNIENTQTQLRSVVQSVNSITLQSGESVESIKLSTSQGIISVKSARTKEIEGAFKKDINIANIESNSGLITLKTVLK